MSLVSTADALLAFLWAESAVDEGRTLSSAVEAITSGDGQLSQQVEVGMAAETLSEQGLLDRETADDRVRLRLTDDGESHASEVYEGLAEKNLELVGRDGTRTVSVSEAATQLGQTVPAIGATASENGVVYREDQQPTEGLVDREDERQTWADVLGRCRAGDCGEAVFLVGSNGIGKTTLAEEMLATTDDDIDVLRTSCGRAAAEPYEPVRELLASLAVEDDPFVSTGDSSVGGATEGTDAFQATQTALFREVTELLAPTDAALRVLFFDDLHRADAATAAYLGHLFDRLADLPVVVLASHVPGKVSDTSLSVTDLTEESTQVTRLELDGLSRMETKQLVEQVVGARGAPDSFVEGVHERTGGTPLYVESTVEALLDRDELDPGFRWYPEGPAAIELPDEVRQTVSSQVDGLDDKTRDILRWTAAAGEAVSVSLLQAVCDQPDEQVRTTTDVLAEAAIFERQGNSITLRSNLTREALLEQMDEAERQRRHETLARHLEAAEADATADTYGQGAASIAYHYEEADAVDKAIEWHQAAADQSTDVYAHETAIDHYHRILDDARQEGMTDRMLRASEHLVDIYTTLGEYDQAERHIKFTRERADADDVERRQRAARLAARIATERGEYDRADEEVSRGLEIDETPSEELCRLLGVAAEARRNRGQYDRARISAERQLDIATELDLAWLRAEALRHLGRVEWRKDNHDLAREQFEECRAIADDLDDQSVEAAAFHDLGLVAWEEGDYDDAEANFQRAVDIREEIGDRHGRARSVHNVGMVAHSRGNYERARTHYERCREIEHELGDQHGEAMVSHNIGIIERARGEYERARECFEECLSIERGLGDKQGSALGLNALGNLALAQGQYDEASDQFEQALSLSREIAYAPSEAASLTGLATVARLQGAYEQASEHATQSREVAAEVGDPVPEANALAEQAKLAHARGEYETAGDRFESALSVYRDAGQPSETADCLCGLAATRREQAQYDAAETALDETAVLLDGSGGDALISAKLSLERARLAVATGDVDDAREHLDDASETFEQVDAVHWLGWCAQARGESALEVGSLVAADDALAAAAARFADLSDPRGQATTERSRGLLERKRGNPTAARDRLTNALETFDSLGARADGVETLERLVSLALDQGWDEAGRDWCETGRTLTGEGDTTADSWFDEKRSQFAE